MHTMLRISALLLSALSAAQAVPVHQGAWDHTVQVAAAHSLGSETVATIETSVAASLSAEFDAPVLVEIVSTDSHRRLQTGATTLTINYRIICGSDCDAVTAQLNTIATDPARGAAHAAAIIAAVSAVAASSGFANAVVSTPAQVAATIARPTVVGITLPPPPAPPPAPPPPPPPPSGMVSVAVTDFTTQGSCQVDGDVLSVTQVAGSQLGQCYTPVDISAADTVRVAFDMYCGDGSGADGLCVNLGKNSLDGRVGEDGVRVGIALCFDEWANGGDHGVMMFYNGEAFWQDITSSGNRSGDPPVSYFEDETWHSVVWDIVPADGGATVSFDFDSGVYGVDAQTVPSYELPADVFLGFTGRTGGATNNHWARNIQYGVGGGGGGGGGGTSSSNAVVTTLSSSKAGMTTYQLHAVLTAAQRNVYAMAGTPDQRLIMPAAFQVAAPFGTDVGGVSPAFFPVNADAEFDSWLTVGATDGSAGAAISTIGLGLDGWSLSTGISANNGAVFWMDPNAGPTGTDPICVAQVTVPAGSDLTAAGVLQGRSVSGNDWSAPITWGSGGGGGGSSSSNAVVTTLSSSKAGMTTYQLHAVLTAAQRNVYAMAGTPDQRLIMPAAFQVAAPFGTDVGGVSPAFFPVNADAEFDSWLTVGATDGSAGAAISTIGLGLDGWSLSTGISANNGAVFWMDPNAGPGGTDPICVAQVTVPAGSD